MCTLKAPPVKDLAPTFQQPTTLSNRRHIIQAGVCRAVAQSTHAVLMWPCLPRTIRCIALQSLGRSLSVPADFPTIREFCWVWEPFLTFSILPGVLLPFWFLFSFSTWLPGDFPFPFRALQSSANVQHLLCENYSICRCILDVLVRREEFHVLLFYHLD